LLAISEPHPGAFCLSALFSDARPSRRDRLDRIYAKLRWVIYGPSISSGGRGVERAGHLLLNALHGAGANAKLAGNFQDALAGP